MAMNTRLYEVDNPGKGDCGFYSFGIGLIPILQKELEDEDNQPVLNQLRDFFIFRTDELNNFIHQIEIFDFTKSNKEFLNNFNSLLRTILYGIRSYDIAIDVEKDVTITKYIRAATRSALDTISRVAMKVPAEVRDTAIQAARQAAIQNNKVSPEDIAKAIEVAVEIAIQAINAINIGNDKIRLAIAKTVIQAMTRTIIREDEVLTINSISIGESLGIAITAAIQTVASADLGDNVDVEKIRDTAIQATIQIVLQNEAVTPNSIERSIEIAIAAAKQAVNEEKIQDNKIRSEIICAAIQATISHEEVPAEAGFSMRYAIQQTNTKSDKARARAIRAAIQFTIAASALKHEDALEKEDFLEFLAATISVASQAESLRAENHPGLIKKALGKNETENTDFQMIDKAIKAAIQYDYEETSQEPLPKGSMVFNDVIALFWHYYNKSSTPDALNSDFSRNPEIIKLVREIVADIRRLEKGLGTEKFSNQEKLRYLRSRLFAYDPKSQANNSSSLQTIHYSDNSLVARVLKEKENPGNWATENDLLALAGYFDVEVVFYKRGKPPSYNPTLNSNRVLRLNQPNTMHWTTLIDLFDDKRNNPQIFNDPKFIKYKMKAHPTNVLLTKNEILNVFNHYTRNNSMAARFWHGEWRTHIFLVNQVVTECKKQNTTVADIINFINSKIPVDYKLDGDFSACLRYISLRYDGGHTIPLRINNPQQNSGNTSKAVESPREAKGKEKSC